MQPVNSSSALKPISHLERIVFNRWRNPIPALRGSCTAGVGAAGLGFDSAVGAKYPAHRGTCSGSLPGQSMAHAAICVPIGGAVLHHRQAVHDDRQPNPQCSADPGSGDQERSGRSDLGQTVLGLFAAWTWTGVQLQRHERRSGGVRPLSFGTGTLCRS